MEEAIYTSVITERFWAWLMQAGLEGLGWTGVLYRREGDTLTITAQLKPTTMLEKPMSEAEKDHLRNEFGRSIRNEFGWSLWSKDGE